MEVKTQTVTVGFKPRNNDVKRFYCGTKDVCAFKEAWVNNRCFAPYPVRATCRYLKEDR